jgi:uncharacterized protein (DUF2147 family)
MELRLAAREFITATVVVGALLAGALPARAQEHHDAIVGRWMVEKKDAIIEIEERGNQLAGRIVWAKDRDGIRGEDRLDVKNPSPEMRERKVLGSEVLSGVPATPKDGWYGKGRIYNPKTGKTYPVKLRLESADLLRLRVGGKVIGQTTRWTRVKK